MYQGQTVFSQLMEFLPRHTFRKCVNRYQGNYRMRSFSCYDQFLCMAFAQLTSRESLRDIECCLRALEEKLYHAGFRGNISRSTLTDANESRDWRIYADFAQQLIHEARTLYLREDFGLQLTETVYALDSSTIDLCLSLFPWARFRTTKAGIKLHTLPLIFKVQSLNLDRLYGTVSIRKIFSTGQAAQMGALGVSKYLETARSYQEHVL